MVEFRVKPCLRDYSLILLLFAVLFAGKYDLGAQDSWTIPKLTDSILFDGHVNEPAWDQINPFPMVMHAPIFGNEPTERTEIMVGYTDDYLYLGARLFYSDISMLKPIGKLRDYLGGGTDWLRIFLDTFNDNENAVVFSTNPTGIRWDATVKFDAVPVEGGPPFDLSWNTFWEVKTTIDENGWYAEMQIPFSSLRFQDQDGKVTMGMTVTRLMPDKNETLTSPAIPPTWGPFSPWKPSQSRKVTFEGIQPSKPLYIAPFALAGYTLNNSMNDEETKYLHDEKPSFEAGLDLKFGLTTNLTMDVTVNTDFAQVEADDQMINLTRFTQFFPEKRIFFLERASIFDFNMGGYNNLFYSRRIGLYEGEPVRIYGGAKIIGRVGEWDLGFLDMQTAALDTVPSENFGVLRIRRRVINDYSYIGGMLTSRLGMDGSYNTAYGLDGIIRLFGDDYLQVKWAQTFETGMTNNPLSMSLARLLAIWQRRNEEGFAYDIAYVWSGDEFNPGIGFEMFENYSGLRNVFQYGWLPDETSRLQSHKIAVEIAGFNRLPEKSFNTAYIIPGWSFFSKNTWKGTFSLNWQLEDLQDSIDFAGQADVPDGRYEFLHFKTSLHTPSSKPIRALIQLDAGTFYDGKKFTVNLESIWDVSAGFELAGTYRYDWVKFDKRDQGFENHIFGIKALYMINTKLSAKVFLQYNTAIDAMITNFRFRYNPSEGNDLYIVFNEGTNFYLDSESPVRPRTANRTIMVKYTYTFSL
jgi:hypothetical protein